MINETETRIKDWSDCNVLYEIHIATATLSHDFAHTKLILDFAHTLDVDCILLMPVTEFAADASEWIFGKDSDSWGYDGLSLMAIEQDYGGYESFVDLIRYAKKLQLTVIQDIVLNHADRGLYICVKGMCVKLYRSIHNKPSLKSQQSVFWI